MAFANDENTPLFLLDQAEARLFGKMCEKL